LLIKHVGRKKLAGNSFENQCEVALLGVHVGTVEKHDVWVAHSPQHSHFIAYVNNSSPRGRSIQTPRNFDSHWFLAEEASNHDAKSPCAENALSQDSQLFLVNEPLLSMTYHCNLLEPTG
jgi:hypothetical protein